MLLELPDCMKLMQQISIPMLWECHREYLTNCSAKNLIRLAGGELVSIFRYNYELEDVLVFLIKRTSSIIDSRISSSLIEKKAINNYYKQIQGKIYSHKN